MVFYTLFLPPCMLTYYSFQYFKNIKKESEIFIENFNSPIEVLRHLKNTGVTGFEKTEIKKIRSFSSAELTYKVGYFLCEK